MFPELPTVHETVPGHEAYLWFGLMAPARTPKNIISTLNAAIVSEGAKPYAAQQLAKTGMESVTSSPDEFARFIKAEISKWAKVVKASGTPIE